MNETVILQTNTDTPTDTTYDVYTLDADTWDTFDDLVFVETLNELPVAFKYNDPSGPARWVFDQDDADAIAAEDPALLAHVVRADADEPINPDYTATYRVAQ